jgi:hypothetical protein
MKGRDSAHEIARFAEPTRVREALGFHGVRVTDVRDNLSGALDLIRSGLNGYRP